jgi:hypothetical protein
VGLNGARADVNRDSQGYPLTAGRPAGRPPAQPGRLHPLGRRWTQPPPLTLPEPPDPLPLDPPPLLGAGLGVGVGVGAGVGWTGGVYVGVVCAGGV